MCRVFSIRAFLNGKLFCIVKNLLRVCVCDFNIIFLLYSINKSSLYQESVYKVVLKYNFLRQLYLYVVVSVSICEWRNS